METCKSYDPKSRICADGFAQRDFCSGHAGCLFCGHVSSRHLPYCMREELPAHMATDDGRPLFYGER